MRHWGVEETSLISPRHSGTEGNQEISNVYRPPNQKNAIPLNCKGDSPVYTNGYAPDPSYSSSTTGGS